LSQDKEETIDASAKTELQCRKGPLAAILRDAGENICLANRQWKMRTAILLFSFKLKVQLELSPQNLPNGGVDNFW
jgi:hypothetical protein